MKKSSKVGGTARWVAETYKSIQYTNPGLSHLEILERVNNSRCLGYNKGDIIKELNDFLHNNDTVYLKGLFDYVFRVIQAESCRADLPSEVGNVILDELSKSGIEDNIIFWRPNKQ